jgi:conjugative relaxase-like TrwC/TraI family protein
MLSLYTLTSVSDALDYYQKGDYYTQGGAETHSVWMGKGAEKLNLAGPVDFKVFEALLEGRLPNGTLMTQVQKEQYHRPGYDLTFSAPKSVSILALVAGCTEVLEAHQEAVKNTIAYLENKYAGCRNKNAGVVSIERTGNYTVAAFEHGDSRAGDPNLHTHCVIMNVTQKGNGDWRALYADEFYTYVLLNGKVYDSYLAQALMQRGFEIEIKESGNFEIKGVPKDLIDFYSKRHAEIQGWLKEHGLSGSKVAEMANFMTRSAKVHANPIERKERWIEELKAFGSSVEKLAVIIDKAKERGPVSPPEPVDIARNAIDSAVKHLSERKGAFSFQEVIKTAKIIALLSVNEGYLLNAIEQKIKDKSLIYLENKFLTTPEANALEQRNIEQMQSAKNSVYKITRKWIASIITTFKTSDIKERQALMALLISNDRQVLLSSNSKAMLNKTLKDYSALTVSQGYYPRIITQNKITVELLKKQFGTERVHTIEGFLLACEERTEKRGEPKQLLEAWDRRIKRAAARDIWIVNGDINRQQLNRLGHFAEELAARVVLTQLKNHSAIEPLKQQGITEIKVNVTRSSVEQLKTQEQLLRQVERLDKHHCVQEVEDYEQRQRLAVTQYLHSPEKEKLLITLSHTERMALNTLLRQALKQAGGLTGLSQTLNVLCPLNMSREEKSQLHLYQPGDSLYFNRDLPNTPISKNSYFEVYKVDLENHFVELRQSTTQILWNPAQNKGLLKHVEVFKAEQREVQPGDILRWNRTVKDENDKTLDRIKGQTARVLEVNPGNVLIKLQNGHAINLNSEVLRERHWDYGYSVHLKDVALQSTQEVVVLLQNKQLDVKNIQLLHELLTTTESEQVQTNIICNDRAELNKTIAAGGYHASGLENPLEVQYQRAEALEDYQTLATQPLFNRLQSETLKISQSNPELVTGAQPFKTVITPELRIACDIVDRVCVYHAERDAVLKLEGLKEDVIKVGGLMVDLKSLETAVNLAIEGGWLIHAGENEQGEPLVTTKHTLLIEQKCIERMQAGKNQLPPILAKESPEMQEIMNHPKLTEGQKQAINLIVTTQDRMVAVQGIAGAGKTTALKEIKRLCQANHYTMVLANTASAKNQAKSTSGIEAKTTAQFLTRLETAIAKDLEKAKKDFGGNRLFILDESSLASSKDLLRLQTIIEKCEARLALVGDFKQQGSIGAGFSFHDLLAYGIDKAVMQENVRLSNPIAFTAMKEVYAGDMAGTLKTLKDSIEEIPNQEEAFNRIVTLYFALSAANKEAPLVIMPLNKDRKFVNEAIRDKLKENGHLPKNDWLELCLMSELSQDKQPLVGKVYLEKQHDKLSYVVLSPKHKRIEATLDIRIEGDLTQELLNRKKLEILEITSDRGHTQHYLSVPVFVPTDKREIDKSDILGYLPKKHKISHYVIRFNTNHPRLNIKAGDYAHILDIDLKHERLTLKINGKQPFYWSPKNLEKPSSIEIYRQEVREFAKNDVIVFKRNNEAQGIFNGDKATILNIKKGIAEILLVDGNTLRLDLNEKQNQHLDHGYALTIYAAQGKDVKWVIGYLEGPKPRLIKASQLKVGDVAVLPKKLQEKDNQEYSKIVQVINTKKVKSRIKWNKKPLKTRKVTLTLKDREGKVYTVDAHEVKSTQKVKELWLLKDLYHSEWDYFPPFEQRKPRELPLSTSAQALLITITRGDGVVIVVPYTDYLQKTLEAHKQLKRSALSYTDAEWQKLHQGANRLVANIKGKVELKNITLQKSLHEKSQTKRQFEKEYSTKTHSTFKGNCFEKPAAYIDKDIVNRCLEGNILGYATRWLGRPKKTSGNEARWEGALTLNFRGPKAGLWKRWSTGEGGKDLISLYMAAHGVEWKVALQELANSLGLSEGPIAKNKTLAFKKPKQNEKSQETITQEKIAKAKALYHKAVPITGTLAEKYLREHRGITGELPKDFRFIKATWHLDTQEFPPALLAPIRDKSDHITGVVRIFLNRDGSKYRKPYIDESGKTQQATPKANLAISGSGAVIVQRGVLSSTVWVAEGIETALSIAEVKPDQTVMASLSVNQLKNIPISPKVRNVVICADNDSASSNTKGNIVKAVESFLSQGLKVFIALPSLPKRIDEYDFNDLLKEGGIPAVQKDLERMVEIKNTDLLKTSEPRLESDLNKIRLDNNHKDRVSTQPNQARTVRLEKSMEQRER